MASLIDQLKQKQSYSRHTNIWSKEDRSRPFSSRMIPMIETSVKVLPLEEPFSDGNLIGRQFQLPQPKTRQANIWSNEERSQPLSSRMIPMIATSVFDKSQLLLPKTKETNIWSKEERSQPLSSRIIPVIATSDFDKPQLPQPNTRQINIWSKEDRSRPLSSRMIPVIATPDFDKPQSPQPNSQVNIWSKEDQSRPLSSRMIATSDFDEVLPLMEPLLDGNLISRRSQLPQPKTKRTNIWSKEERSRHLSSRMIPMIATFDFDEYRLPQSETRQVNIWSKEDRSQPLSSRMIPMIATSDFDEDDSSTNCRSCLLRQGSKQTNIWSKQERRRQLELSSQILKMVAENRNCK